MLVYVAMHMHGSQLLLLEAAYRYTYTQVTNYFGLLVLYSIKQFENLPLQLDSHARMHFNILPLP
jgi:hypothetical protein